MGAAAVRGGLFAPINVRSETASRRFKWLMDGKRRLVLADGWDEWLKAEKTSGPAGAAAVPLHVDDGAPFAFAGLFDGTGVAILTTEANELCAPVHDRMPVVLGGPKAQGACGFPGRRHPGGGGAAGPVP